MGRRILQSEKRAERAEKAVRRAESKPVYTAQYKVNRSDELLAFLLRKCDTSRNNVKSLLTNRQVLVNGSVVTQYNFMLAKDDEVKISKTAVRSEGNAPKSPRSPSVKSAKLEDKKSASMRIIYEDEDFIAVDKPAGLLSVESDKERESAFSHVFDYLQSKNKSCRPFILHRIDKETSGVLVFAKNIKLHSMLRLKWNDLVQTREYYALVDGNPNEKEGTITTYLKENKNNLMYSALGADGQKGGQKAITHFAVEKENAEYALLKVKIDTGRKNQIRVHMSERGTPVVGDDKYGGGKNPLGRLGLHASMLTFMHPVTGEMLTFRSPVPPVFFAPFSKKS